jgi:hypothetical protein
VTRTEEESKMKKKMDMANGTHGVKMIVESVMKALTMSANTESQDTSMSRRMVVVSAILIAVENVAMIVMTERKELDILQPPMTTARIADDRSAHLCHIAHARLVMIVTGLANDQPLSVTNSCTADLQRMKQNI